jgi:hypothetical protein
MMPCFVLCDCHLLRHLHDPLGPASPIIKVWLTRDLWNMPRLLW